MNRLRDWVWLAIASLALLPLRLDAHPEDGPRTLRGKVLAPTGTPLARVEVYLSARRQDGAHHTSARAHTADDGTFRFELPGETAEESGGFRRGWTLAAYKDGHSAGGLLLSEQQTLDAEIHVRLEERKPRKLQVLLPDGSPAAACQVTPEYIIRANRGFALGDQLSEKLTRTADQHGQVTLEYVFADAGMHLWVQAPGYGRQVHSIEQGSASATVALRPVGSLRGRVTADEPSAIAGLAILVGTPGGPLRAQTDDSGSFEFPHVVEGTASIYVNSAADQPYGISKPINVPIAVGKASETTIALERGVHVRGRVIDDVTEQGIRDAHVYVGSRNKVTNEDGRFEAWVQPGSLRLGIHRAPGLYLEPYRSEIGNVNVPEGVAEHELPPLRLRRGVRIEGTVIDETGEPVEGARITISWDQVFGMPFGSKTTTSGPQGRFVAEPVPAEHLVGILGYSADRATPRMLKVETGNQPHVLTVKLQRSSARPLSGRVVDPQGNPIAAARISIQQSKQLPTDRSIGWEAVFFHGQPDILTDQLGHYETPNALATSQQYMLAIEAAGMAPYQSPVVSVEVGRDAFALGAIELTPERSVSGRIVDGQDRPVADAAVWSYGVQPRSVTRSRTDASGNFRLGQLHPDARFVFVEKAGYRFGGAPLDAEALARIEIDEEGAPAEPLPFRLRSADESFRYLDRLVKPLLPQLKELETNYFLEQALLRYIPYDPQFVLEQLPEVREQMAQANLLMKLGNVDEALDAIATIENVRVRTHFILRASRAAAASPEQRRIAGEALIHARGAVNPEQKLLLLTDVADRLWELDRADDAQKLVQEGQELLAGVPRTERSEIALGHFASALARVDAKAARELLGTITEPIRFQRSAGRAAHELAAMNPAAAEEMLGLCGERRADPAVRVCYRMAATDLDRARRIADHLPIEEKVHAYGVMAMQLADTNPATARELLRAGFDALAEVSPEWVRYDEFDAALALVGYAEAIDPDRLREYVWRAIAVHGCPALVDVRSDEAALNKLERDAKLVILLALYGQFPEMQRALMDRVFENAENPDLEKTVQYYHKSAIFVAMALSNPERALEWHTAYYPKVAHQYRRIIRPVQPWLLITDSLCSDRPALHQLIAENAGQLWTIDNEDP